MESIKTSAETQTPQSTPYRPQVQTQQPQSRTSTERVSPSVSSPTPPQNTTGNVKTQSSISREAEQKIQSQTDSYHKSGAYDTAKVGIQSETVKTPRTVESIKTGGSPTPEQHSTYKPQVPGGTAYQPQTTGTFRAAGSTPLCCYGECKNTVLYQQGSRAESTEPDGQLSQVRGIQHATADYPGQGRKHPYESIRRSDWNIQNAADKPFFPFLML